MRRNNRRLLIGIFGALAVPLFAASAAYACQKLVTLHANPQSAPAGTAVDVTGVNYDMKETSSNVDIRLDSRNGPVLASIPPSQLGAKGDFTRSVTIPEGTASGNHIFVATQTLANGSPCVGCPGRANIEVTGASASAAENSSAAGPSSSSDEQKSGETSSQASSSEASQPASQPSEPAPQPATASEANQSAAQPQGPVATQAAPPAATASAQPAAAATKPSGSVPAAPAAAPVGAAPALAATDAVISPEATATAAVEAAPVAPASGVALLPAAAGERPNIMPALSLATALALVLMGVGAFWKSRMTLFGPGNLTPAVG